MLPSGSRRQQLARQRHRTAHRGRGPRSHRRADHGRPVLGRQGGNRRVDHEWAVRPRRQLPAVQAHGLARSGWIWRQQSPGHGTVVGKRGVFGAAATWSSPTTRSMAWPPGFAARV